MQGFQGLVAQRHGTEQAFLRLLCLVARNVLIALDIRADGEIQRSLVGTDHADVTIRSTDLAPLGIDGHASHKAHLALQPFVLGRDTQQCGLQTLATNKRILVGCSHIGRKRNTALLAGRQVDGNDGMAAQRGYRLTLVLHTVHRIADDTLGMVKVQPALIVLIVGMTGHGDVQVAEGLVRHSHVLPHGIGHHLLVGQLLRLLVFTLEDELAHPWQRLAGVGVHHLVGLTGPQRLLVQLDVLHGWRAEHHATDDAITHRQRLRPRHGRLVVPQSILTGPHREGDRHP